MAPILGIIAVLLFVSGCSTETNAIVQSLQYAFNSGTNIDIAQLNPNSRYLRTSVNGRVVLLALGYVDPDPEGSVEVWYSADREVVRLQNGRVVGAVGFSPEWRGVEMRSKPKWSDMISSNEEFEWERVRDIMPGYRSGVVDKLVSRRIDPVHGSALVGIDPEKILWFEDIRISEENGLANLLLPGNYENDLGLPPARFAVAMEAGTPTAIYGEQCLSRKLCLTWQRWPLSVPSSVEQSKLTR